MVSRAQREGLITRIRQLRRAAEARDRSFDAGGAEIAQDTVGALDARIAHLEQMVQGLQDSVHREARRQDARIADLEARIEPAELNRALTKDARDRGL